VIYGKATDPAPTGPGEERPGILPGGKGLPDLTGNGNGNEMKPRGPSRIVSVLSEAQLINKIDPVYPKIAIASGIQGQVKLHAIIARNGKIESLELISGPPLLVQAALDAVRQWRYRPYYLNGEAVEVETFITVNFRRENR
jgi:protein TonB